MGKNGKSYSNNSRLPCKTTSTFPWQYSVRPSYGDLLPTRVLELFEHRHDEDCEILWMDPAVERPENLILQTLLKPPVSICPSVAMDSGGGSDEVDFTIKLQEMIDKDITSFGNTMGP